MGEGSVAPYPSRMKQCTRCLRWLPARVPHFYIKKGILSSQCRRCIRAISAALYHRRRASGRARSELALMGHKPGHHFIYLDGEIYVATLTPHDVWCLPGRVNLAHRDAAAMGMEYLRPAHVGETWTALMRAAQAVIVSTSKTNVAVLRRVIKKAAHEICYPVPRSSQAHLPQSGSRRQSLSASMFSDETD